MLDLIRSERQRRADLLAEMDEDLLVDCWLADEAFVNDLCLMLLVAVRHQAERRLVSLAVRIATDGSRITPEQYRKNVTELKSGRGWIRKLGLDSLPAWNSSMKTLQLLANCYKHSPSAEPEEELLKHLKLPPSSTDDVRDVDGSVRYMPLPESNLLREGLAVDVGLEKNADYCTIAERFVAIIDEFLKDVQTHNRFGKVTGCRKGFFLNFGN